MPTRKAINKLIHEKIVTKNGYETQRRVYGGAAYQDYPVMAEYIQSKYERRSWVGVELLKMKKLAHECLLSSRGKEVCSQSPIEKEAVFGRLKHNWGFRRFMMNECLPLGGRWHAEGMTACLERSGTPLGAEEVRREG